MNKEVTYDGNKVIVTDEYGNIRKLEYSDNIEDILQQENIIEDLEDTKKALATTIEENKNSLNLARIHYKYSSRLFAIVDIIITLIIFTVLKLNSLVTGVAVNLFNLSAPVVFSLITLGTSTGITELVKYFVRSDINALENDIRGAEAQQDFIMEELIEQRRNLRNLKNVKSSKKINNNDSKTISLEENKIYIEDVKRKLELYEACGFEFDWLLKHYKKGDLQEVLDKIGFDDEAIARTDAFMKKEESREINKRMIKEIRKIIK